MSSINKDQIRAIQATLSRTYKDREERLSFLSDYFNRTVKSTKELTFIEAKELLHDLNGDNVKKANWGAFDLQNKKHKVILSQLYTLNWTVPHPVHGEVPDIERLSSFLKSSKSPVQKPLEKMKPTEVDKIIQAFKGITKSTYK